VFEAQLFLYCKRLTRKNEKIFLQSISAILSIKANILICQNCHKKSI